MHYKRFDGLIKNKANDVNQNVKLEFNKTKIHLNLKELNLAVKLQNPKILIKIYKILNFNHFFRVNTDPLSIISGFAK